MTHNVVATCLPVFTADTEATLLLDFYQKHQILHVRGVAKDTNDSSAATQAVHQLRALWTSHPESVAKHWSVENAGTSSNADQLMPASVLGGSGSMPAASFYVSTILQGTENVNSCQEKFLSAACPHAVPPFFVTVSGSGPRRRPVPSSSSSSSSPSSASASASATASASPSGPWGPVTHCAPVWVFLGNHACGEGAEPLAGRPEHTDAVGHSGTWHYQVRAPALRPPPSALRPPPFAPQPYAHHDSLAVFAPPQLAGRKIWRVRPLGDSDEWGGRPPTYLLQPTTAGAPASTTTGRRSKRARGDEAAASPRLEIDCKQGDFLLINTRLWWHATCLPAGASDKDRGEDGDGGGNGGGNGGGGSDRDRGGSGGLSRGGGLGGVSMSFARDFYCPKAAALLHHPPPCAPTDPSVGAPQAPPVSRTTEAVEYTNVEGIYASRAVRRGCIVLRESELPDCALPRSRAANCEVAVDEETGEGYLVATKNIRAGDWLAVPPSDSEADEEEEEVDEEDGF